MSDETAVSANAQRQCDRFRDDGSRCTNVTDYVDGWCRTAECAGRLRASATDAPESQGPFRGTRAQLTQVRSSPDRDVDWVDGLAVSRRAVESFVFHHGGDRHVAETELAMMVEDFAMQSVAKVSGGGFLSLAREGFELVLNPDRTLVTGYNTVHRERTWSQVKAGVRSRFRGGAKVGPPAPPEKSPVVCDPPSAALDEIDPGTIHFTGSTLARGARMVGPDASPAEVVDHLRRKLVADIDSSPTVERSDNGAYLVYAPGGTWILRSDLMSVLGFRPAPEADVRRTT